MKRSLILLNIILCISTSAQITFQKRIRIALDQSANAVNSTSDGGYLICGAAPIETTGYFYMMKLDSLGDNEWTTNFNGIGDGGAYDIIEANDGGIISTGYYTNTGSGSDVFLFKTDSAGSLLWMKMYGGSQAEFGFSLKQSADHSYIIGGYTTSVSGDEDIYLVKTDSIGELIWDKAYTSIGADERALSVEIAADGGYIITGYIVGTGTQSNDLILMKTDTSGTVLWSKKYSTPEAELGTSVVQSPDGGYLVTGTISSNTNRDMLLIKTDSLGNLIWSKKFNYMPQNIANKIIVLPNGKIVIAASVSLVDIYGSKFLALCTDSNGNPLWSRVYGRLPGDEPYGITSSRDGGLVMAGVGDVYLNILVVKTDSIGYSGCFDSLITMTVDTTQLVASIQNFTTQSIGIESNFTPSLAIRGPVTTLCMTTNVDHAIDKEDIKIYPNPATNEITLDLTPFSENISLLLVNSMGEIVFKKIYYNSERIKFDVSKIAGGIYRIILHDERNIKSSTLIIEK